MLGLFAVHLITVTDRIKHLRLAGAFFIEKNKKVLANKIFCQPEGEEDEYYKQCFKCSRGICSLVFKLGNMESTIHTSESEKHVEYGETSVPQYSTFF